MNKFLYMTGSDCFFRKTCGFCRISYIKSSFFSEMSKSLNPRIFSIFSCPSFSAKSFEFWFNCRSLDFNSYFEICSLTSSSLICSVNSRLSVFILYYSSSGRISLLISNVFGSALTRNIAPSLYFIRFTCLLTIPDAIVLQNYLCVTLLLVASSLFFNRSKKAFRKPLPN